MAFQERQIGFQTTRKVTHRVCKECGYLISDTGLCDGDCAYDADVVRPKGTVVLRTYECVDTLVSVEIV